MSTQDNELDEIAQAQQELERYMATNRKALSRMERQMRDILQADESALTAQQRAQREALMSNAELQRSQLDEINRIRRKMMRTTDAAEMRQLKEQFKQAQRNIHKLYNIQTADDRRIYRERVRQDREMLRRQEALQDSFKKFWEDNLKSLQEFSDEFSENARKWADSLANLSIANSLDDSTKSLGDIKKALIKSGLSAKELENIRDEAQKMVEDSNYTISLSEATEKIAQQMMDSNMKTVEEYKSLNKNGTMTDINKLGIELDPEVVKTIYKNFEGPEREKQLKGMMDSAAAIARANNLNSESIPNLVKHLGDNYKDLYEYSRRYNVDMSKVQDSYLSAMAGLEDAGLGDYSKVIDNAIKESLNNPELAAKLGITEDLLKGDIESATTHILEKANTLGQNDPRVLKLLEEGTDIDLTTQRIDDDRLKKAIEGMNKSSQALQNKDGELSRAAQDSEDSQGLIGGFFTKAKNWLFNTGPARAVEDTLSDWDVSLANAANAAIVASSLFKLEGQVISWIPKIGGFLVGLPLKLAAAFEGLPIVGQLANPLLNIATKIESLMAFLNSGNVFSTLITKITQLFSGLGGPSGIFSTLGNVAKLLAKPIALLAPAMDLFSAIFDDGNKSIGDILIGFVSNLFGGDKEGGIWNAITNALKGAGVGFMVGGPVGAIVGAIVTGIGGLFGSDKIKESINSFIEFFKPVGEVISTVGEILIDWLNPLHALERIWDALKTGFESLSDSLSVIFDPSSSITDKLLEIPIMLPKALFKSLVKLVPKSLREIFDKFYDNFKKSSFGQFLSKAADLIMTPFKKLKEFIDNLWNKLPGANANNTSVPSSQKSTTDKVIETVTHPVDTLQDKLSEITGGVIEKSDRGKKQEETDKKAAEAAKSNNPGTPYLNGTDYVPAKGSYLLHPGERVLTSSDNKSFTQVLNQNPGTQSDIMAGVKDAINKGESVSKVTGATVFTDKVVDSSDKQSIGQLGARIIRSDKLKDSYRMFTRFNESEILDSMLNVLKSNNYKIIDVRKQMTTISPEGNQSSRSVPMNSPTITSTTPVSPPASLLPIPQQNLALNTAQPLVNPTSSVIDPQSNNQSSMNNRAHQVLAMRKSAGLEGKSGSAKLSGQQVQEAIKSVDNKPSEVLGSKSVSTAQDNVQSTSTKSVTSNLDKTKESLSEDYNPRDKIKAQMAAQKAYMSALTNNGTESVPFGSDPFSKPWTNNGNIEEARKFGLLHRQELLSRAEKKAEEDASKAKEGLSKGTVDNDNTTANKYAEVADKVIEDKTKDMNKQISESNSKLADGKIHTSEVQPKSVSGGLLGSVGSELGAALGASTSSVSNGKVNTIPSKNPDKISSADIKKKAKADSVDMLNKLMSSNNPRKVISDSVGRSIGSILGGLLGGSITKTPSASMGKGLLGGLLGGSIPTTVGGGSGGGMNMPIQTTTPPIIDNKPTQVKRIPTEFKDETATIGAKVVDKEEIKTAQDAVKANASSPNAVKIPTPDDPAQKTRDTLSATPTDKGVQVNRSTTTPVDPKLEEVRTTTMDTTPAQDNNSNNPLANYSYADNVRSASLKGTQFQKFFHDAFMNTRIKIIPKSSGGGSSGGKANITGQHQNDIWNYLTGNLGWTPQGAAGAMGNFQRESGCNPDRLEGDYISSLKSMVKEAVSSPSAMTTYTQKLFGIYARDGVSIDQEAYKGSDGNYYSGLGIAQWTGPRAQQVGEFSGGRLDDLSAQLELLSKETGQGGNRSGVGPKMKSASDVAQATKDFGFGFEGNVGETLSERTNFAQEIYNKFANGSGSNQNNQSNNNNSNNSGGGGGQYEQGTPWVPSDQVALLHEGEAVIPAEYNPYNDENQLNIPTYTPQVNNEEGNEILAAILNELKLGINRIVEAQQQSSRQSVRTPSDYGSASAANRARTFDFVNSYQY